MKKFPLVKDNNSKNKNCNGPKHIKYVKIREVKMIQKIREFQCSFWRVVVTSQQQNDFEN